MTLVEQISKDMTEAMKAREQGRLSALRMVKAALMNGEVSKGRPLEEGEAQQVLASLIKQRRDSIEQFRGPGARTWSIRRVRSSLSSSTMRRRPSPRPISRRRWIPRFARPAPQGRKTSDV